MLISDSGFDGLVLKIGLCRTSPQQIPPIGPEDVIIKVPAGDDWDAFVAECVDAGLSGIECLSGIPGSIGGTPVQNVGAYGQEVSDTIVSVRCFDRQTEKIVELSNTECGFCYRKSIFNTSMRDRYIVLEVTYSLCRGGDPMIEYKDIANHFAGKEPTLFETRSAVLQIRRSKSMVIVEQDENSRSAGSFFKNPIVPKEMLAEIERQAGSESTPFFTIDDEKVKVPAAWLIETAGFHKGFVLGRVGISSKHTLAIINRGGASAQDVMELKEAIQEAVKRKFGIELRAEPVFVGFSGSRVVHDASGSLKRHQLIR